MTKVLTPGTSGNSFEELSKKAWIGWGKVYVGTSGGSVVVDYIVKDCQSDFPDKGKKKASSINEMNIVLPTFSVSVARLEAIVDLVPGQLSMILNKFLTLR
jgi:hypothetical protein